MDQKQLLSSAKHQTKKCGKTNQESIGSVIGQDTIRKREKDMIKQTLEINLAGKKKGITNKT